MDPDGKRMNPIYSVNGDFLGTDDEGLQGEPIVMEKSLFTQNMSHEDAEFFNMGIEIYDNFTREIQTMHYEGLKKKARLRWLPLVQRSCQLVSSWQWTRLIR